MTEEALKEILIKHTQFQNVGEKQFSFVSPESILSAMKEAMRIESDSFVEFLDKNYKTTMQYNTWRHLETGEEVKNDQLYNEYLKSK